ncbi:MAG: GT4 family glycosyltransferase PelF [Candidatus Omnitrophota bacterium]|jgi:lipopolysaccharide heptosyltransferase II
MNILQILPELNVGGVETGTVDLAKYLVRLGHKSVVVSAGGPLVKDLQECGAIHYQLPVHRKSLITGVKMVFKLAEIIRKEEIDIVHARSRVPAWIAYFASRKAGKVFITTCHGYYSAGFLSSVMGWGRRVIVPSNVIALHMINDFGVPHERIRLISRSVDLEKFEYAFPERNGKKEFTVGIIGRLTSLKGHIYFIKAMAKAARVIPSLKVLIVGDAPVSKGAYKEQLQILVRRLGLWNNIEFLGSQKDIPGILKNLDVLVLSTITHEAFGRVIIEAQAAGVPVVATSVGGVVDIIDDNKTGLLVPPADSGAIAEAVLRIHKDERLARTLSENAYAKVKEKYTLERMAKNTLAVYKDALMNAKILIIKLSSLGDVILSTPAIKAIRDKFKKNGGPDTKHYTISFLVGKESKDVLLACPYIDELLVYDYKNRHKGWGGFLNIVGHLRKRNFDIVIDLQNNRRSHILSFLTRALDRYGYRNKKFSFLLNHAAEENGVPLDPVTHQFRILKLLGIELRDPYPEVWPSGSDEKYVDDLLRREWLSPAQKIVGINISASSRWQSKVWPMENLIALCGELSRNDMRIVVTGTEADLPGAQMILQRIQNSKVINACGRTSINQLVCLIKKCSVYISGDSAPLHIAAGVKVPFVALFGPTDYRRHLPSAEKFILLRKEVPCGPCYKSSCTDMKCMKQITPEEVLEAVEKLLND